MAKDLPFDDDVMTMIMGVGGPDEPGQHGRTQAPFPTEDAIDVITQIRDLCDDFLSKAGKDEEESDKDSEETEEIDIEEEE